MQVGWNDNSNYVFRILTGILIFAKQLLLSLHIRNDLITMLDLQYNLQIPVVPDNI